MKRSIKENLILYTFLTVVGIIFAFPMLFTLLSSLKTKTEIFLDPFALPEVVQWSNYYTAWESANMSKNFINSMIQSSATVIILVIIGSMAAFYLARFNFKTNKYLSLFFLLGMMVPMHTVLVPVSYIIGILSLKNNIFALILTYVAFSLPFTIYVLTSFMKNINQSLEEAAIIDGANYWQIYIRVILPLVIPAVSTVSIFNFLGSWNNVIFPLLFINDNNLKPIALGLLNFNGERGSDHGPLMAAIVITVAVPFFIYMVFQEKVESGLTAGSVKE